MQTLDQTSHCYSVAGATIPHIPANEKFTRVYNLTEELSQIYLDTCKTIKLESFVLIILSAILATLFWHEIWLVDAMLKNYFVASALFLIFLNLLNLIFSS
jgi:hypothetical protein